MGLTGLDWTIITLYLAGMIGLSAWLARGQRNARDYYLGGNKTAPLPIALSTMATQCSTNSLLGAPAFVAFTGGFLWLQYELAVPFAMILLIGLLFPVFRRLNLISLYEYLERRFGLGTRVTLSLLFQFLRAFSTGVTVFGIGLVLELVLGVDFFWAVLLLAGITVIYDVLGGMRAVIWSDVIQIIVLWGSILGAIFVALELVGGLDNLLVWVEPEKLKALDFGSTGFDGQDYGFWPMLIGGLFLYVSYYGCDQTQAQRELSTRSEDDTTRALFLDGMLRFPLVLSYCFLGICIAAYAAKFPQFLDTLPIGDDGELEYNKAVPLFVMQQFPPGMVGLVIVGLFAAAMSSLDSTLNALSAVSMQDIYTRFRRKALTEREEFWISKAFTIFWGVLCVTFSFFVGEIGDTVIESINMIGSLINGPLLAVFIMGLLVKRTNGPGVVTGLLAGFITNLLVMRYATEVSWLWWNVIGFLVAVAVAIPTSLAFPAPPPEKTAETTYFAVAPGASTIRRWWPYYLTLFAYGVGILLFLAWIKPPVV